jgi:hypothetical protein
MAFAYLCKGHPTKENKMNVVNIAPSDTKFPVGWHAILNQLVLDLLSVQYFYGDVVAAVGMGRSQVNMALQVCLHSETFRPLKLEASTVMDQIHDRVHQRTRATCCICGGIARGSRVSHCGEHSDTQMVPYAELESPTNQAWRLADFHMMIDGTRDDMIRTIAKNQQQLDAAAAFVQTYDAPEISQTLAQAQSMRAALAIEKAMNGREQIYSLDS